MQLPLRDWVVFAEYVHQVGDVAGRESERFDLGQFRVGRNVWNAASERGERRVDAMRSTSFLAVGAYSLLDYSTTTCNYYIYSLIMVDSSR